MEEYIKSRPQRLCLMCGKCCRVATTSVPYAELIELAKGGDESAKDFLRIFEPYSSPEDAKKIEPDIVDNIFNMLSKDGDNGDKITFYKCKYIREDNLCGIYQDRPELCERFPTSMFAVIPPGCGYEGWAFKSREELKNKIRKLKELRLELESDSRISDDEAILKRNDEAIKKIDGIVMHYSKYGSKDW